MDRAHRIGQTKEVRVFRLVTEKSVEEKVVERADRKLFLDAAVIQQGRLAEKHAQLSKSEVLHMVRFGADEIMNSKYKFVCFLCSKLNIYVHTIQGRDTHGRRY